MTAASNAPLSAATSRGVLLRSRRRVAACNVVGVVAVSASLSASEYVCAVERATDTEQTHLHRDIACRAVARPMSQTSTPNATLIYKPVRAHPRARPCPKGIPKRKVHRWREYSSDLPLLLAVTPARLATSSRTISYLPLDAA